MVRGRIDVLWAAEKHDDACHQNSRSLRKDDGVSHMCRVHSRFLRLPHAMTKMQGDAKEKQEMRVNISNFLRRLMKGTFPEYESYTFFRSGSHGFPNCI